MSKEESKKLLLQFEDRFERLAEPLDILSEEITVNICANLGNYESHLKKCPRCSKDSDEVIIEGNGHEQE